MCCEGVFMEEKKFRIFRSSCLVMQSWVTLLMFIFSVWLKSALEKRGNTWLDQRERGVSFDLSAYANNNHPQTISTETGKALQKMTFPFIIISVLYSLLLITVYVMYVNCACNLDIQNTLQYNNQITGLLGITCRLYSNYINNIV